MSGKEPTVTWKAEPDEHDYPAAADFLSLLLTEPRVALVVDGLRGAETLTRKAKDLMRASRLPLLPADDPHVVKDLRRVANGVPLSPVLLVRGQASTGLALIVADGYHRICASYHLDEDADITCRIAELS